MEEKQWDGQCSRPDCSRTEPAVAFGKKWGICFTHEMLGSFFQYEMWGFDDGWIVFDEFEQKYEAWLKKLIDDGVNLDELAQRYANS